MRAAPNRFLVSLALICVSAVALAQPSMQRDAVDIPAQALSRGLQLFAQQTGLQIAFAPELTTGLRCRAVKGIFTPGEALEKLLEGSGLHYRFLSTSEVAIIRDGAGAPPNDKREEKSNSSAGFREAQAGRQAREGVAAIATVPGAGTLQEVIVTAQKYRQRAIDVPISLVVLGSQELQKRGIDAPEDLQFAVPGLTIMGGGIERRINLRGLSNVNGNGAVVGEYIDDADMTSEGLAGAGGFGELDTRMYDLERVEVLRGPQGTLFGVGAMGGAIRFITHDPVLDRFQMSSDVAAMFTQYGAPSQRIEAMINTPIVTDTLGLRFAGEFEHDGGWIDIPAANLKNFNSGNLVDARIEGLWQPSGRLKVKAMQIIHRNAYGLSTGESDVGTYQPVFDLTLTPNEAEEDSNVSNLTVSYDFDYAQLLSSSTYYNHVVNARNVEQLFTDLGGLEVLQPDYVFSEENFSEELRLAHTDRGLWQWTLGAFFKHFRDLETLPAGEYAGVGATLPTGAVAVGYFYGDRSNSWSTFADTSYRLFDRLTLGAGVRYFKDSESSNNTYSPLQEATFTSADPRVYVQYRISQDINAYASAAKGFRSGGFNSLGQPPYGPESVWTYELGTKMRVLDRRLSVDADVFYSNYSNYVVYGLVTGPNGLPFDIYSNAGLVRIKGVEGNVSWRPSSRWELGFNGEALSAKFAEINVLGGSAYQVGERVDLVPPYSLTGSVERDFSVVGRVGFALVDYSVVGRQRYAGVPPYLGLSEVIHMLGFSAGIHWSDELTLGIFAQNLLNDRGYVNPFATESGANRSRPRTLGVDFQTQFN